jgi:hypothetical protein
MLLPERKSENVGDVVVAKEPAVDPADRATAHEDDRQPK